MSFTIGVGPQDTTDNDGGTTAGLTLNGVSAGRSLLVCVRWFNASAVISSISCTDESNLTLHTRSGPDAGGRNVQWATLDNVTTGGNKTITVTFDVGTFHVGVMVVEVIGGNVSDIFDAVANASGSSADPTVNITTGMDGNAIFAACFTSNANELIEGAGYTAVPLGQTTGTAHGEYDLDAGAAGSKTANFTDSSGTGSWVLSAIALNVDTAGVGSSAGVSTAAGISAATAASTGSAAGTSTALFIAEIFGETFTLEKNLPAVTLAATFSPYPTKIAEFSLPAVTLESTLLTGPSLSGEFLLPGTSFAGEMFVGNALIAAFSLPAVDASAALHSDGILNAEFILPGPRLAASLLAGQLFSSSPNLPALSLAADMLQNATLSAAFNLPVIQLPAELSPALAATFRTWVLNTRRNALTEYDFEFTSYALFNGLVLGVSPAGVVVLGIQGLDGSEPIIGRARLAKSDYGETHLKRVPRLYVGGEFAGDVLFRTIVDATGERTYRLTWNRVGGMQQRRVPIGKGPKARYWQYEIEGENGADFVLENVLAYPTGLRRRVM